MQLKSLLLQHSARHSTTLTSTCINTEHKSLHIFISNMKIMTFFKQLCQLCFWVLVSLNKNNFVTSFWTDFEIVNQTVTVEGADMKSSRQADQVGVGDTMNLTCQASRAYEYCTWSHNGGECKFEWKRVRYEIKYYKSMPVKLIRGKRRKTLQLLRNEVLLHCFENWHNCTPAHMKQHIGRTKQ